MEDDSESDTNCCRICLDNDPSKILLSPCNCRGSAGFVHEECMLEWGAKNKRIKQSDQEETYELECEVCKENIPLSVIESRKMRTCQRLVTTICETKIRFIFEFAAIVSSLVSIIFSCAKANELRNLYYYGEVGEDSNDEMQEMTFSIISIVTLTLFFLPVTIIFLYNYAFEVVEDYHVDMQALSEQLSKPKISHSMTSNEESNF